MVDLREVDPASSPSVSPSTQMPPGAISWQYTSRKHTKGGAAAAAKAVVDKPYKIMTAYDDSDEDEQPPNLPPEAAPSAPDSNEDEQPPIYFFGRSHVHNETQIAPSAPDSNEDEQPPNLPPEAAPSAPIVLSDDSSEDEQQLQSSSSKAAPSAPPPSRNLSDDSDLSDALSDEIWNATDEEIDMRRMNISARLKVRQKLKKLKKLKKSTEHATESEHKTEGEGEQKLKKVKSEKEHKTAGEGEQKLKKVKSEKEHKAAGDFETEGDFKIESEQMTEGEGEQKLKKVKTEGDFETGGDIETIENFLRWPRLDPFTVTESEQKNEGQQELQKVKAEKKHKTEGEQKLQKVETEKEHKTEGEHNIDQRGEEKDRELHDDSSKGQLSNRKEVLNIMFFSFPRNIHVQMLKQQSYIPKAIFMQFPDSENCKVLDFQTNKQARVSYLARNIFYQPKYLNHSGSHLLSAFPIATNLTCTPFAVQLPLCFGCAASICASELLPKGRRAWLCSTQAPGHTR